MSDLAAVAAAGLPAAIEAAETELAKGLASLLGQVYGDTLSPGAKQVGALIEDAVKTVRLLAWPLQMGSVLQDRFRRDLTSAMEGVAPHDRQIPSLKLFADCCEGSKFEDDPGLLDMWHQLLSRGCDRTRAGEAHPAFPGIIKQLASDEAKLLTALRPFGPRIGLETPIIPTLRSTDIGLAFSDRLLFYTGHLGSLGLLMLPNGWDIPGYDVMIDSWRTYLLSPFGQAFMTAVSAVDDPKG